MIELLEQQSSLTRNQWKIFFAVLFSLMLDLFDFVLIGFVLPLFMSDWHLTYGQSALILLSSGLSSFPGGIFFGWLGDKIGRRKVFIITILTFSFSTGAMALTPEHGWVFLTIARFLVGLGVAGVGTINLPLLQEFLPASQRGWLSGLSACLIPGGGLIAAILSAFFAPIIGWRGLFAIGLFPALMALVIYLWIPESPRWLIGQQRMDEARRSLGWALQIDYKKIVLPASLPERCSVPWQELFKYPRSITVGCLVGLGQTGLTGMAFWEVALLMQVLKITHAQASYLVIWQTLIGIMGRIFASWLSDALGRRRAGTLTCLLGAVTMSFAGYLHNFQFEMVSTFYLFMVATSFFGNGSLAIVFPYMGEIWPSPLRASGYGLTFGISSLGRAIGPAGLAVIVGASDLVSPKATIAGLIPAFNYFALWFLLPIFAFIFLGIETRGRTFEELDAELTKECSIRSAVE